MIYFSPEKQTAHLRCRDRGAWTTTHLVLQGPGILEGAQSCQISLGNLQLYAEIRGSSQFDEPSEPLIITLQLPVTSDGELQALRKVMDTHRIDQLIARVNTHKMEADLADLVKLDPHGTTNTVTNTHWTTPLLLVTSVIVTLYYCTCTHGKVLLRGCGKNHAVQPLTRFQLFHHQRPFHQPHHPWTRMVLRPVIPDQTSLCMRYKTTTELTQHAEKDSRMHKSKCSVAW